VIWFGEHLLRRVPMRVVRLSAAAVFGVLGLGVLLFGMPEI